MPFAKALIWLIPFILWPACSFAAPWVIAHRGGNACYPENTLLAFSEALQGGADAIELDVQVTADGVVVVYHPADLQGWTDGAGTVASKTWQEISQLDAGYRYAPQRGYPFRGQGLKIPSLAEVLLRLPKAFLILDLKALPADRLVQALVETISDEESERLAFYSTDSRHIECLEEAKPHWKTFEKRDVTRQRLLELHFGKSSYAPTSGKWLGFELKREMQVIEALTLGEKGSSIEFQLWNPAVVKALRQHPGAFLILFGIETREDWQRALELGVDAVYTNNPQQLAFWKREMERQPSVGLPLTKVTSILVENE
ncbi:MAG: glpQ [Chlamydiales bacterium]|nr:glpQ [Chlamydiales bacterium]